MKLPVIKPRSYLSPSAFNTWKNCPMSFYYYYLAGYPYIEPKQNYTACLGSVFDSLLKNWVARQRGMPDPHLEINRLLSRIKPEEGVNIDEVIEKAKPMVRKFIDLGLAQSFVEAREFYAEREIYRICNGVPLLGIPDMVVDGVPVDIKLRGFGNNANQSPTPGYFIRVDHTGKQLGAHKDAGKVTLVEKKEDWATQMLWYNWLLNNTQRQYTIYEILQWNGDWQLAVHSGTISLDFSQAIFQQVEDLWNRINVLDVDVPPAIPSRGVCERYNSLCIVAKYCTPYKDTLGSENRNDYI